MEKEPFVSEKAVAQRMGLSLHTVKIWRLRGSGPPHYRLGTGTIRYLMSEVETWMEARRNAPSPARRRAS